MVNVIKGVLIKCDPAMKQFLCHLSDNLVLGTQFVLSDLDECHLFVDQGIVGRLQSKVDELLEKLSNPPNKSDE
ncbi:unnamed protein product [Hymenolepis diminuta]|uniref:General transcription and DNA repair factor IIH subunit TFB5 n=1 Tax=Hymenolepis diminuta TaxID=6216 RepID=A0A0R3SVG7_HYMDI|nr:unnamed protein product [Hymenolepis diminuta]VUZ44165.1 unnamed protein product [Hymenolepis diminuta]